MSATSLFRSLTNSFHHAATLAKRTRNAFPRPRSSEYRPRLELLESRELMAAAIGMNLEPVTDYMGAWVFTDAFQASRPWVRTTNGRVDLNIPLDQRGNPAQLTTGQRVETTMFSRGYEPPGPYTAWWQGDGAVRWGGDVDPASIQLGTTPDGFYHTALLTVPPPSPGDGQPPRQGISMTVQPTSAVDVNPIHDVHVWMPDYQGRHFAGRIWQPGADFSPFHPLFLQRLAPFHNLRFMPTQDTSTSSLQHWSGRRAVNDETQQSSPETGLVSGQSSGGNTATTLNDAGANWADNQWAGLTVQITGTGPDAGQVRTVVANTAGQLTLSTPWSRIPGAGSTYAILVPGPQTGRSTGGNTPTTLTDSTQSWSADQWAGLALRITAGSGEGQARAIVSNTGTRLTLGTPWVTPPDATSTYAIESSPGIAPEYIVELSNELHADAWINIPHMAQDDFISGLATLVHNTFNTNQHVYLEWSNEAFNGGPGFDAYPWITSQVGTTWDAVADFAARQATHAFGIWAQVFADHPGQLVRVAAGFNGGAFYNTPFLAAMDRLGHNFDAFAVAPYFGPDEATVRGYTANTPVTRILDDVAASIAPTLSDLRDARGLADQYHVRFVAYEGGPSVQEPPGTSPAVNTLLSLAARDPRNYDIFSRFLGHISTIGLDLFDNFQYTDIPTFGIWGALDHQDQPVADAHKYRALLDYMGVSDPVPGSPPVSPPPSPPVPPLPPPAEPLVIGGRPNGTAAVYAPDPAGSGKYIPTPAATLNPFGELGVAVRTAVADVNGDGFPDSILVTGPGTPIRVAVVSGADHRTLLVPPFDPFGGTFTGGGFVAAGDFDHDGRAEFVVTPDRGGGPRVSIFSLTPTGLSTPANFFGIDDPTFRGGARAAVGDVDGDGTPDLVIAAGFGGGPRVAIFNGTTVLSGAPRKLVGDFFAFPGPDATNLRNGTFVAVGDLTGAGAANLIFGGGPGGAPRVLVLSGQRVAAGDVAGAQAAPVANFFVAGNSADRGGVRVAAVKAGSGSRAGVAVGSGEGSPGRVRVYPGKDFAGPGEPGTFQDLVAFGGVALADGVYVG
ncbi:MAG: hypothetical protein JWO38_3304 [Gemmataceae bacterium]|nr:hypothetical protein [Gemmataceae bacterium]